MATEAVYGLVRNGVARDLIGSKEFMRFVPLLFTFFMLDPRATTSSASSRRCSSRR